MSKQAKTRDELWANPPASYRSAPFWSWNSELDPERLRRAIESMHEVRMGGFFMHSRYGLKTPYLSDAWFECISACVEKARELQMKAYLYDEDRWPSGAAGGLVTRGRPEYAMHFLEVSEEDDGKPLRRYAVETNKEGWLKGYRVAEGKDDASPGEKTIVFNLKTNAPRGWHNDGAYLDTMNREAVAEFIRVTHEAYAERYSEDFGDLIPAIFTDEPNYGSVRLPSGNPAQDVKARLPWTADLPDEFKRRRGYDLLDHLPALVFPLAGDAFSKVRYDYYRTITELFVENWSEQIGAWCGAHRIALTGHMLAEETLASQIHCVGAAMPHYEHMQWPGIDILTDQSGELATAKQCTSVAAQLGRPRALSELYGCTGWDWPLDGHKFVGDWHLATGINLRCPHLTHYSLAGGAKRDYPASLFAHSPWWRYYGAVEDYFARLAVMLTQGRPVRDILVVHPIESAWGLSGPPDPKTGEDPTKAIQDVLNCVIRTLSFQSHDWDFGDESLMAKHAEANSEGLKVGRMTYRLVIVPAAVTLRATTVERLSRFQELGGSVLFIGQTPTLVDGEKGEGCNRLADVVQKADRCGDEAREFLPAIEKLLPRRISIREDGRETAFCWSMLRSVEDGQILFIHSHDRKEAHTVTVRVAGGGPVTLWDALSGRKRQVAAESDDGHVEFELRLPPTGSALVTLGLSAPDAEPPIVEPEVLETKTLEGPFEIERTEPNTFPLDYCRYRVGEGEWSKPMPSLKADAEIRARYGLGSRLGGEHQPWYLYATGVVDTSPRDHVEMRRTFHVTDLPRRCKLALERPEDYQITVNGQAVEKMDGWWVDEDIKTIDIGPHLRIGENEILLSFDYRPDMELEDMYLVGEFGVANQEASRPRRPGGMTLTSPPERLALGSWVGQRLDFYSGSVRYRLTVKRPMGGKRLRIRLPRIACTAAVIHAGGRDFVLPWPPFAADITDTLAEGENQILVEVIGGRKNILGPLHTPWGRWTGPGEFDPNNEKWTDDYLLTDHGLMAPVVVETTA